MQHYTYSAPSEQATVAFGAELAAVLPPVAVVALNGTLGAGKTRLVQAVAAAAGVESGQVTSPTFVLIHEYLAGHEFLGPLPIYHFDAYRIADDDAFLELGPDEYFYPIGQGWSFVEWAESVERCLPPERLEIRIELLGPTAREFHVTAVGACYEGTLDQLARRLGAAHQ